MSDSSDSPAGLQQRTEVRINVYDLLPPGHISTTLWLLGGSILHSGVVINDKEYAYGGHDRAGMSGVYWTRPRLEPPGGTFRCEILQGVVSLAQSELDDIIKTASKRFTGRSYNLLKNNCNHFTSYLCEKLTSRPAPAWLNRAASIGIALPCVIPRELIAAPDHETADGELLDEDVDIDNERTSMLRRLRRNSRQGVYQGTNDGDASGQDQSTASLSDSALRDTSGRVIPVSERAPTGTTGQIPNQN